MTFDNRKVQANLIYITDNQLFVNKICFRFNCPDLLGIGTKS